MKATTSLIASLAATGSLAAPVFDNLDSAVKGLLGKDGPFDYTSVFSIHATPEQVVDSENMPTGGLPGAEGFFEFGLNAHEDVICYNITLTGFQGEYESAAKTATHIHEAKKGLSGPPRIAFPNPVEIEHGKRQSLGCLRGPFTTGLADSTTGEDTGLGFTVKMLEEHPTLFNADTHSSLAVPGAVRGQFKSC